MVSKDFPAFDSAHYAFGAAHLRHQFWLFVARLFKWP
jgi:hypothetical protein